MGHIVIIKVPSKFDCQSTSYPDRLRYMSRHLLNNYRNRDRALGLRTSDFRFASEAAAGAFLQKMPYKAIPIRKNTAPKQVLSLQQCRTTSTSECTTTPCTTCKHHAFYSAMELPHGHIMQTHQSRCVDSTYYVLELWFCNILRLYRTYTDPVQ